MRVFSKCVRSVRKRSTSHVTFQIQIRYNSAFAMALDVDDLAELRAIAQTATRPRVSTLLQRVIEREHASSSAAAPTLVSAPPRVASAPAAANVTVWTAISNYGWEQTSDTVTVTIFDQLLSGVGTLSATATSCEFTSTSFDLRVRGLSNKNLRLLVTNLEKDILPAQSTFVVGKNRITLRMKKVNSYDHFINLVSKKPRVKEAKAKDNADPTAGIMDLMKDMYEDGDDQTKKVIAEAFAKSREKSAGGQGSSLSGGFGGGGFGGSGLDAGFDDSLDV